MSSVAFLIWAMIQGAISALNFYAWSQYHNSLNLVFGVVCGVVCVYDLLMAARD